MHDTCKCHEMGYRDDMTYEEVREFVRLGRHCTSFETRRRKWGVMFPLCWICPTVDKALRTLAPNEHYQKRRRAELKSQGYAPDQIEKKLANPKRKSRKGEVVEAARIEFDFDELPETPKKRGRIRTNG